MTKPVGAPAYAKALFLLGKTPQQHELRLKQLEKAQLRLEEFPKLLALLKAPDLPSEKRKELLKKYLLEDSDDQLVNFFDLIVERNRTNSLMEIVRLYRQQVENALGILSVKIVSPMPFEEKELQSLREHLQQIYSDKTLKITEELDPTAIGGIVVQIGNRIVDGSVKTRLEKLKEQLLALPV